jgi:phenylalanyl-tRNA synthetase alpha chain
LLYNAPMAHKKVLDVREIQNNALAEIGSASSLEALEKTRIKYLGRKGGIVTKALRALKSLSLKEKKIAGPRMNKLKVDIENALRERALQITNNKPKSQSGVDITAPGKKIQHGHLHPLTLIDREIRNIFKGLNFSVVEGPEIETEYYNFDALNIPAGHPARDMWDTFWLRQTNNQQLTTNNRKKIPKRPSQLSVVGGKLLLRTHTSPMQVRYMERHTPPFQIIVPGRVFRFEATDATHEFNLHQVEGLMVGPRVSLANFKYVIEQFFDQLFHKKIEMRLRPSYFPFTEPSVEVDIKWRGGWLEVMGAGMVHPKVFKSAGYNPRNWQGFAFGVGLERLAMIKYEIPDIRLFHSGDLRFIHQF